MIKPDGVQRGLVGDIVKRFERKGFKLVAMKFVQVRPKMCSLASLPPDELPAHNFAHYWANSGTLVGKFRLFQPQNGHRNAMRHFPLNNLAGHRGSFAQALRRSILQALLPRPRQVYGFRASCGHGLAGHGRRQNRQGHAGGDQSQGLLAWHHPRGLLRPSEDSKLEYFCTKFTWLFPRLAGTFATDRTRLPPPRRRSSCGSSPKSWSPTGSQSPRTGFTAKTEPPLLISHSVAFR